MKKGLTELVFILDKSGSRGGLENDTIGGFNAMLAKQKEEKGEANVTTVLFDDEIEVIHDRFPIEVVKPLTKEEYSVRGCTALLDAVGSTIKKVKNIQKHLPEDMKAEKIIFVITTDGQENASREYSYKMVKKMIEKYQEKGWQFIFMGANIDVAKEVRNLGINANRAVTYKNDSKGVRLNYMVAGNIVSYLRCNDYKDEEADKMFFECTKPIAQHLNDN